MRSSEEPAHPAGAATLIVSGLLLLAAASLLYLSTLPPVFFRSTIDRGSANGHRRSNLAVRAAELFARRDCRACNRRSDGRAVASSELACAGGCCAPQRVAGVSGAIGSIDSRVHRERRSSERQSLYDESLESVLMEFEAGTAQVRHYRQPGFGGPLRG